MAAYQCLNCGRIERADVVCCEQPELFCINDMPETIRKEREARGMFVARLNKMQEEGHVWLTIAAVFALLNDCDFVASQPHVR